MSTGADTLSRYIRALAELKNGGTRENKRLLPAPSASAIPARSGASGRIATGSGTGTLGALLVETAYAERTFHDAINISSTDGLFTLKIKPVKTVKFADTAANIIVLEYKVPT